MFSEAENYVLLLRKHKVMIFNVCLSALTLVGCKRYRFVQMVLYWACKIVGPAPRVASSKLSSEKQNSFVWQNFNI